MPVLQTSRLYLRELTPDDAATFYLLNADPEVMKFTGDAPFGSVDAARAFLENYSHYKDHGFGRWAVIRKEDNIFLGWCGLKYNAESNEHDIGFRFFREHWNKGYATEAAKACLDHGFTKLGLTSIIGRAMAANTASIRVLEKLGMKYSHAIDFCGSSGVVYISNKFTHL